MKRLLRQFTELARKEIEVLILSDEHPNVSACGQGPVLGSIGRRQGAGGCSTLPRSPTAAWCCGHRHALSCARTAFRKVESAVSRGRVWFL